MGIKTALKLFERFSTIDRVIGSMRYEKKFSGKVPDEYEKHVKKVAEIFLH